METGIYKITCSENNRIYIGSAKNLLKRWLRHLNDLRNNKHVNIHLQRTYDKYGENSFKFEIVENCDVDNLLVREQYYLDLLKPEFNIGKNACGGDNLSNNPNKEDIVSRIKETINNKISSMTKEERKEKWNRGVGKDNPNFGNKWTEIQKERSRQLNLGKIPVNIGKSNIEMYGEEKAKEISEKLSKIASERIGDKNGFYNKKHSEESKDKIRQKRIGKKPVNRIKIDIDGVIYDSYHDASKELSIPVVTIRWRCLSKNEKFNNYKLIG